MYWFFSPPGWGLVLWSLSMLLILVGGWLLVTHVFTLESRERLLAGFALGLVCYLWLVNWLGRLVPPFWAYFGAAFVVLLAGVLSAYPFRSAWLDFSDLKIGSWIAAGILLFWVFLRISKGTGLFDEYKNLALISTLADGWIPPVAYFGWPMLLRYHYGFHYLGASLMQLAHLAPWSAFDLSKSIVWSLSLLLAGLVGRRYVKLRYGSLLMACAVALPGGSRWLMLLLPSSLLSIVERHVRLTGIASGALSTALSSSLPMEAGPVLGYPFAFLSGINQSFVMAHGGAQTIEPALLMLALLLMRRSAKALSVPIFAILFSYWALASETSVVLLGAALVILVGVRYWRRWNTIGVTSDLGAPILGLLLSIPLILVQGGVIGSMAQQVFLGTPVTGPPGAEQNVGVLGFLPRWPPAILSGQLGSMAVTDPWALAAGILEMGVIVLMLPWLTWRWWRTQRHDWLLQLLLLVAWMGILIPLFVAWASDSNVAHITDFGLDVTVLILVLMLTGNTVERPSPADARFRLSGILTLALMAVPGVVLLGIQLTAAQTTILSEHYGDAEARLLQQAWGRLPPSGKVLGYVGAGSILTGHLTGGIYSVTPSEDRAFWDAMLSAPRIQPLVQAGFDFIYMDSRWWSSLDAASQQDLQQPCVTVFARGEDFPGGKFAEILDLRGCR